MKRIILFLVAFSLSFSLFSQNIVEVTLQETLTKEELSAVFLGFPVNFGIEAYKVLYETLDTDGTIDTASGLMVLPVKGEVDQKFPFLAYQHGTASSRNGVPSNPDAFERRLAYYFAGQGYYTTAADYLGLGESRRIIHPYIHADSEASAGIDLVKAAKTFTEENDLPNSGQLFMTGYSQGGHASMAMHRELDVNPIPGLLTTAGSHMSGIYNVSGELAQGSVSAIEYQFPSYVVWILVGYQTVYGNLYNELSDIFNEPYIEDIQGFLEGTVSRGRLNDLLKETLIINHEASIPRFMFTDSFISDLENNPDSPAQIAMRDNDLFNWVPKTPMRMMYCTADDQVAFTNSTFTDSIMNAAGAENVMAVDVNTTADHGGCVIPATFGTIFFFDEFVERPLVTSTLNLDQELQFTVSPNPASGYINLNFSNLESIFASFEIRLINMNGQTIKSLSINNLENYRLPLNDISGGLYLMQVQTEKGFWTEKIIIRNDK